MKQYSFGLTEWFNLNLLKTHDLFVVFTVTYKHWSANGYSKLVMEA